MVPTGISEFTFGFAFLHEQTLLNSHQLRSAPILPSLQAEADAGWDARLPVRGLDYYYQFKLSDYLSFPNANFIADGTYGGPYYRFAFHRRDRNRQHGRLRRHCRRKPLTYYVAPEFSGLQAFNQGFLARQISQQSRLIPLRRCRDVNDGAQHYITYQPGDPAWLQHSEPTRSTESYRGSELLGLLESGRDQWKPIDYQFAERLFEETASDVELEIAEEGAVSMDTVAPLLRVAPDQRSRGGYLRRTADLLSVMYGLTLVLVGEPPPQDGS